MANVVSFAQPSTVEDEATLWLVRLEDGLDPQKQEEFQQWLTADKAHLDTFMTFAEFWDITDQFQYLSNEHIEQGLRNASRSRNYINRYSVSAIAACVVMALAFVLTQLVLRPAPDVDKILYSTQFAAATEPMEQTLPDGSVLSLNAQTTVAIIYSEQQRIVRLQRGEVFIDVASNPQRPLTVHAGGLFFRAVGTAFAVASDTTGNTVELVVTEGRVQYGNESDLQNQKAPARKTTALAGEKVVSRNSNFQLSKLTDKELEYRLSWRSGYLAFNGEPLHDVLNVVSRYTDLDFEIVSDSLKNERIIGRFKAGDIDDFLETLSTNFNVGYERRESQIRLWSKSP